MLLVNVEEDTQHEIINIVLALTFISLLGKIILCHDLLERICFSKLLIFNINHMLVEFV